MQTNPELSREKSVDGPRDRGISPVGKEKVYHLLGKGFTEEPSLEFRMKY